MASVIRNVCTQLYNNPCYKERVDPACEPVHGQCHPECLHAEIGGHISEAKSISCKQCTQATLARNCDTRATNLFNSVAGNLAPVILTNALTQSSNEGSTWLRICEINLDNVKLGVNDACLPTHDCMVMGSCRLPQFGDAPKGECGVEAIWRASDPGLTAAQLAAAQPYLAPATADCSTLEDRAIDGLRLQLTMARRDRGAPSAVQHGT